LLEGLRMVSGSDNQEARMVPQRSFLEMPGQKKIISHVACHKSSTYQSEPDEPPEPLILLSVVRILSGFLTLSVR
jgi:hypothetical protein